MKVLSLPLVLLSVVLLLNTCKKDDDSIVVNTLEATNIGSHLATLNGEVVSNETPITGWGFFWSETNPNPDKTDNIFILADINKDFSAELTGLEPKKKYYVRAYASDIKKFFYGQTVEFTTISLYPPSVTTKNITNITQTSATSGGTIASDGGDAITARGVCWNTTTNPTIADNKTNNDTGIETFTSNITGLMANTTYYVRAYATNSQGTAYGEQVIFKTFNEGEVWWKKDTETEVVEVLSASTGKIWMDRNLGAKRAATSLTDTEAYGDLYQWGREADGHQKRNSPITSTLSNTDTPGHGSFILGNSDAKWDWRSPKNNNLWQGVYGINNPCPSGYRLPTEVEWNAEWQSWSSENAAGAFASPLKLPLGGYRDYEEKGSLSAVAGNGYYWSSTKNGYYPSRLNTGDTWVFLGSGVGAQGHSVRCIKD